MKPGKIGYFLIGSAVIWEAVLIGCALRLKGTGYYDVISPVLIGGTLAHLLLIWGPLAARFRKDGEKTQASGGPVLGTVVDARKSAEAAACA